MKSRSHKPGESGDTTRSFGGLNCPRHTPKFKCQVDQRREAVRRIFPKCWLNEATTEAGLDALRYYHEQR
jgi:hypothetical protein